MMNQVMQCAAAAAKFGLAGATIGLPAGFFIEETTRLNKNVMQMTIIASIVGVAFGALQYAFSTMVALGSLALCFRAIMSNASNEEYLVLVPGALVTGGGIGYFTETFLKTAFVYSNRIALLSSLIGAVATITYHSPWRTGNFDWNQAADAASFALMAGTAGAILDFTLKAIKA